MSLVINKNLIESEDIWSIDLEGDVDINTSNKLKEEINSLLDEREANVELNFKELSYIDSTGLGVLISILKRVKKNENKIVVKNSKKNVFKLFKITGLDKVFELK
ncbi:STAS domain-containing protein [Helicovermis profundi]|uniref:Anti-sigma factor antagonist n=1 Tax=Helicovermis profundi TaxID=3065157 RepID=A0AAU9DZL8_9FIRM|nr:STAS domain-containing protein [Clostridia bacterium S502]